MASGCGNPITLADRMDEHSQVEVSFPIHSRLSRTLEMKKGLES
jgi:hypothetical protein